MNLADFANVIINNFVNNNQQRSKIMKKPSSKNPNLSPITKTFLKDLQNRGGKPLYDLSPEEARMFLVNLQRESHKHIDAEVADTTIYTGAEDGSVDLRIIRPLGNNEKLPLIFYIHGGGWILGNKETHDMLIRKLSIITNSVVVFPEYTLSPEAKFPTAINQCYAALKYIDENSQEFNIDPKKIVIAGDSVGANMAIGVTLKTKYDNGPKIIYQILLYPVTNADMNTKSYELFKDGPWLTKRAMEWFFESYICEEKEKNNIYISPFKIPAERLEHLPPAMIITAENDVLRDEGEMFARRLKDSGVDVYSVRVNGTIHDFMMLNALFHSVPAKCTMELIASKLNKLLH